MRLEEMKDATKRLEAVAQDAIDAHDEAYWEALADSGETVEHVARANAALAARPLWRAMDTAKNELLAMMTRVRDAEAYLFTRGESRRKQSLIDAPDQDGFREKASQEREE